MRATEVIRNILDILDAIDQYDQEQEAADTAAKIPADSEAHQRLSHIADLLDQEQSQIQNTPNPQYAGIDAVTQSGNDVNKSKNPADIRGNSQSLYPSAQWRQ
jgi:hypothetical protein